MPNKEYDFAKILFEYNKKYKHRYKISSEIFSSIIVHTQGTFYVKYKLRESSPSLKASLADFVYYNVSRDISISYIRAIIQFKGAGKLNLQLKILPSNKIRYAYLDVNYFSSVGCLGSSCMRYKEMQKALNFYIKNNVKIVVVIDNNSKIHARALLWENVKSTELKNPFTYLDRVFFNSDYLVDQFRDLAKENKWKSYNSTSAGKGKYHYYIDNIDITGICYLPYTDTFRFLFYRDNLIAAGTGDSISCKVKYGSACVSLTHTSGGGYQPAIDPDGVQEMFTRNHISKKDAIFVKRYKAWVLKSNIADVDGNYYSKHDNIVTKTELDGFILKDNSVSEALTNNIINKLKATHSPRYNGYIHRTNIVHIKGKLYHKQDTNIVCLNDKWYHISQCFRNYSRKKANEELAQQPLFHIGLCKSYVLRTSIIAECDLIPKECAVVMYNLVYSPTSNSIEYQEVYCTNKQGFTQLITGELIINSSENKRYLKKFNNKWYIKQEFKLGDVTVIPKNTPATFRKPNKNQLTLF